MRYPHSASLPRSPLPLAIAFALALPAVQAQSRDDDDVARILDNVIVTGTRVGDRTVAESISPIDVITAEALEATGTFELATALSRVLPSLNFPRPAIADGTDAIRPAQLRGLASDQVLVLVNGKRRHTTALINLNGTQGRGSSPVDFNAIPIAAIERVEVLRDGASAQYGSDAIAGVINVVLKGSSQGGSLLASYGVHGAGDGEQYQAAGDTGIALGENGFLHLAGQYGHQDQTDRARPFIGTPTPASAPLGVVVQRQGDPEADTRALSFNAEIGPSEGVVFYAFGSYTERDVLSNGFFRPAGDDRNIPQIYPNGFLPQINNVSDDRALVVGVRGTTAFDWDIDLSYNYGGNELTFDIKNTLNRSLGATSPTEFYAGKLEVGQDVLNLDISRGVEVGLAYPLNVAFGAEWRGEKFKQGAGEPLSYADTGLLLPSGGRTAGGSQVFPGFRPEAAGSYRRESHSLYLDLEADISDRFSAGLAARYENYSDFGTTTSGKASARYAFSERAALRGTVSSGFRAPSLQQQFFQSVATNFIGGIPFDVFTFRVDSPTAIALGAEPLDPEESTSLSLGLVLQPADALYVTIDAYQIEIDDRIYLSENLVGTPVQNFLAARGIFGVNGGRYFTNALDTRTRGIDVVATYRFDLAGGTLDLTAGLNYNETDITRIAPNPPELEQGGLNLQRIGRVEIGRVTKGAPRDKVLLGGTWRSGAWSFGAAASRYGEVSVFNANPTLDQTFGAKWLIDLSVNYSLDRWNFTLGGDNVLNEYPDEVIFANSTSGQFPYSAVSPFGFNGAFAYAKVGYRW